MLHSAIINKDSYDLYNLISKKEQELAHFKLDITTLNYVANTQRYLSKYNALLHLNLTEEEATVYIMKVLRYTPLRYTKSVKEILNNKYELLNKPCESVGFSIINSYTHKPYLNTPAYVKQNKEDINKELEKLTENLLGKALDKLKDSL